MQAFDFTGYRKHPRLNLWAKEGSAFFLNAKGHKLAHEYSPARRAKSEGRGYRAPSIHCTTSRACHVLMGEIFYGERPTFIDRKGNPYFGICHHLIEDPLDYRPENLLCWLTYSQHAEADRRRRALETVVPDGDLTLFTYERLRDLQDPRSMSRELFDQELAAIRSQHFQRSPLSTDALMLQDMTHHCEV